MVCFVKISYNRSMQTITWSHPCYYCHRPITRGRPTLLFAIDSREDPSLIGVSHSTCCFTKLQYGHFQMCPPDRFFKDQVSFLTYFYSVVFSLPGGEELGRELRWSLLRILHEYPASMKKPLHVLQRFVNEHQKYGHKWLYVGDLETDYLKSLGQIQRMAREKPVEVEADFGKPYPSK